MEGLARLGTSSLLDVIDGWALTYLWRWFITPIFGVGELSIAQAIGIAMIASHLLAHQPTESTDTEKYSAMILPFARSLLTVGIGWIVQHFV